MRTDEVADVAQVARVRILRYLERRGLVIVDADALQVYDELVDRDPPLAQLAAAAVAGLAPAGPALHRRQVRLAGTPDDHPKILGPLVVADRGFNLHAPHLCRGSGRSWAPGPAQVRAAPAGRQRPASKSPRTAGSASTSYVSSRTGPTPSTSTLWHCSSPRRHRPGAEVPHRQVRRRPRLVGLAPPVDHPAARVVGHRRVRARRAHTTSATRGWAPVRLPQVAGLLRLTFAVDVESCPSCARRMKLVALLKDRDNVARFLGHLGLPTKPSALVPPRGPPFVRRPERPHGPSPQADIFHER